MDEPREYTVDEVRKAFLDHVWAMVDYWNGVDDHDKRRALEGLAFSILVMIDGHSAGLPAFVLAPSPHPDDRAFHAIEGDNWWPENGCEIACDIGGGLHDLFYKIRSGT